MAAGGSTASTQTHSHPGSTAPVEKGLPRIDFSAMPDLSLDNLPAGPDGRPIVARVNGRTISKAVFLAELHRAAAAQSYQMPPGTRVQITAALAAPVLDKLILDALMLDYADSRGTTVTDAEIDAVIEKRNRKLPPGRKVQDTAIHQGKSAAEMRDEIRVELVADRVKQHIVAGVTPATPEQLKEFLGKGDMATSKTPTIRASHIVIGAPQSADSAKIEK
jgi:hypothetical protein